MWAHTRFKNWWTSIFQSKTQSVFVQAVQIKRIHDGPFDFRHAATYFHFEVLKQTRYSDELDVWISTYLLEKVIIIRKQQGEYCLLNPSSVHVEIILRPPPATQRAENPRLTRVTTPSCNNELRHACIRTQFRICNLLCIYQYYSKSMKYILKINETKYSHCKTKTKTKKKPTNNRAILYKFELNSTKYVQVFFSV